MQRNSSEARRHNTGQFNFPYVNPAMMNLPSAVSTMKQKKMFPNTINIQHFFWSSIVLVVLFFNWPFSSMGGGEIREHRGNGISTVSLCEPFRIRLLVLRVWICLLALGDEFPFHVTCELKNWYPLPRPYLEGKSRSSAFYSELAMWIIHLV